MSRGLGVLQRRALDLLRAHPEGVALAFLRGELKGDERNLARALGAIVTRRLAETWLAPKDAPMSVRWTKASEDAWLSGISCAEADRSGLFESHYRRVVERRYRTTEAK